MKKILLTLSTIGLLQAMATDIIVIAHANVPKMDTKTIAKVFTGKAVIVNNVPVTPFNFEEITLRNEFLQKFLTGNFNLETTGDVVTWCPGVPKEDFSGKDN